MFPSVFLSYLGRAKYAQINVNNEMGEILNNWIENIKKECSFYNFFIDYFSFDIVLTAKAFANVSTGERNDNSSKYYIIHLITKLILKKLGIVE